MKTCPNPECRKKGAIIDTDFTKGTACCTGCGHVLEENATVTEITFAEGSHGQVLLVGQHVGADGRVHTGLRLPGETGDEAASFLRHGRQDIYTLKSALGLKKNHADEAISLFRIALQRNFVKVCRTTGSAHMLIDFSEVVKVNVFKIGAVFLQFIKLTNLRMPLNDPSLYIHRFVGQLKFDDDTSKIANTALRLIARMKRDWMVTGRRPSGLCGAAIVIASRMHNYFRSMDEVVRVVRVAPDTVQKRLMEFRATSAAFMTRKEINAGGGDDGHVESLRDVDVITAEDPPCVKRKRSMVKLDPKAANTKVKLASEESKREKLEKLEAGEDLKEDLQSIKREAVGTVKMKSEKALKTEQFAKKEMETVKDEIDDYSSSSDEDMDQYLNNEVETHVKTMIWEHANREYIEEQEAIEKLKVENPAEFKKRYPWRVAKDGLGKKTKSDLDAVLTAGQVLETKSSKINYKVLNTMIGNDESSDQQSQAQSIFTSAPIAEEEADMQKDALQSTQVTVEWDT